MAVVGVLVQHKAAARSILHFLMVCKRAALHRPVRPIWGSIVGAQPLHCVPPCTALPHVCRPRLLDCFAM
jgi:hypothetical protein